MKRYFNEISEEIATFLFELTSIPSISHEEKDANEYCFYRFSEIPGLLVEKQFIGEELIHDSLWSPGPLKILDYQDHFNLVLTWEGTGHNPPIYLNAHTDTVAACDPNLLITKRIDNRIYGLGVHDDKAHIATIFALFNYLSTFKIRFSFDVIAQLVIEEEIGGNGSLFAVKKANKGQAAILLDGCEGHIYHSCRGAIWPRIRCFGESSHPSDLSTAPRMNALDRLGMALDVIREVHKVYCAEISANPPRYYEGLLPPLNIGEIHAGNWPSTVPTVAEASMVFGFFPGSTSGQIVERIETALARKSELSGHYEIEYLYKNEPAETEPKHTLVQNLRNAFIQSDLSGEVMVSNAACDIGYYRNVMGIPAVNIGIGEHNMHSKHESVDIKDVLKLAEALARFLNSWTSA